MNINQKDKNKIIAIISALIPEAKIYLFGSRAQGTHRKTSDIDIALNTGKLIEPLSRLGEVQSVLSELYMPYNIDVVDYHMTSPTMQSFIDSEGILWKA